MSYGDSGKSLLARFRGLFGRRLRVLCVGVFLMGGALGGMPIPPEQIEEHLHSMSRAKMVQLLEQEQQPAGDPPGSEGETDPTMEPKSSRARIDG